LFLRMNRLSPRSIFPKINKVPRHTTLRRL
jgi:hypothetical protein